MNELHLFAGAGGGILAGQLLGHQCVCAVEREPYAQAVLVARQNDGTFPPFPIWDDVCTFDGRPWRGLVDVVAGGFPCQDISVAGGGDGLEGERSGLWSEMARIVREVRPCLVYVENSPMLTSRGLGTVLGDLAAMGFDAQWGVVSAADTGAPHLRERIWILANARGDRRGLRALQHIAGQLEQASDAGADGQEEPLANAVCDGGSEQPELSSDRWPHKAQQAGVGGGECDVADAMRQRQRQQRIIAGSTDAQVGPQPSGRQDRSRGHGLGRWPVEPGVGRTSDGLADGTYGLGTDAEGGIQCLA